jgi:hypothetical protein
MLLFTDEIFAQTDVFVGKIFFRDRDRPVVRASFPQILAIQGAIDGISRSAPQQAGQISPCTPGQ